MAFALPALPPTILALPFGLYGISYDISTRDTEDDLPDGWHAHRGTIWI